MKTFYVARLHSPLGTLAVASSDRGASALELEGGDARLGRELRRRWGKVELREDTARNRRLLRELSEYFDGRRKRFTVPVDVRGTEFQERVWRAMRAIPYGETWSYGEVAKAVGIPGGGRAVGMACNRNPLPLLIPCHRVIAHDGTLGGFGGRIDIKIDLLQLEGAEVAGIRVEA